MRKAYHRCSSAWVYIPFFFADVHASFTHRPFPDYDPALSGRMYDPTATRGSCPECFLTDGSRWVYHASLSVPPSPTTSCAFEGCSTPVASNPDSISYMHALLWGCVTHTSPGITDMWPPFVLLHLFSLCAVLLQSPPTLLQSVNLVQ